MDKNASVESSLERLEEGGRGSWHVEFRRNFNDWEIDVVASFFHLLDSHIPTREGSDRMRWKLNSSVDFTVCSFYEFLQSSPSMSFPWKAIWRTKALRRVSFFVWTAAGGEIPTCKNLIKRVTRWWVVVVCVIVVGRPWITSWLIVMWPLSFRVWYLGCLGFSGYYRRRFLIY